MATRIEHKVSGSLCKTNNPITSGDGFVMKNITYLLCVYGCVCVSNMSACSGIPCAHREFKGL